MAIGVAAVAVVSVIALYRPIVMAVGEVRAMDEVDGVLRAIEGEWGRRSFLENRAWVDGGTRVFASRDGRIVAPAGDPAWADFSDAAKVYEAVFLRDAVLSPSGEGPQASLHVIIHVAWPAFRLDGVRVTEPALQQHRFVRLVLNR